MYFCYLDESGTPEPAGTTHFVLAGFAIPARQWKPLEVCIQTIKLAFSLGDAEVHTAWMARRYAEQEAIVDFDTLSHIDRRQQAQILRDQHLFRLASKGSKKQLKAAKLNYRKTDAYAHLSRAERTDLILQLADCLGNWVDARLFAQVVDKNYLKTRPTQTDAPYEYAFTELVQRFEYFLVNHGRATNQDLRGLIVQDNNKL